MQTYYVSSIYDDLWVFFKTRIPGESFQEVEIACSCGGTSGFDLARTADVR